MHAYMISPIQMGLTDDEAFVSDNEGKVGEARLGWNRKLEKSA